MRKSEYVIIWGVPTACAVIIVAGIFGLIDGETAPLEKQLLWLFIWLTMTISAVGRDIAEAVKEAGRQR